MIKVSTMFSKVQKTKSPDMVLRLFFGSTATEELYVESHRRSVLKLDRTIYEKDVIVSSHAEPQFLSFTSCASQSSQILGWKVWLGFP